MNTFMNYLANLLPTVKVLKRNLKRVVAGLLPSFLLLGGILIFLSGQPATIAAQLQDTPEANSSATSLAPNMIHRFKDSLFEKHYPIPANGSPLGIITASTHLEDNAIITQTEASNIAALETVFVPNQGQQDAQVDFVIPGFGGSEVQFSTAEVVFSFPRQITDTVESNTFNALRATNEAVATDSIHSTDKLELQFVGANPTTRISGINDLPGHINYYVGNDPSNWQTKVPIYGGLIYEQLYSGIDLHFAGDEGNLKGTYFVAPGADPNQIQWQYKGATNVYIDESTGDLQIEMGSTNSKISPIHTVTELAPVAWQEIDGQRIQVEVQFSLLNNGSIGFSLEQYNPAYILVIDPTIIYSTLLSPNEPGYGIATNSDGEVFVVSTSTYRSKVYIARLNANAELIYATIIGDSSEQHNFGYAIVVDSSNFAYVTGETYSENFPIVNGIQTEHGGGLDAVVIKIAPDGILFYSSYLGGDGDDSGYGIAVDSSSNIYIAGGTKSSTSSFPWITPNAFDPNFYNSGSKFDAFVTKLNASGNSIIYGTYLGHSGNERASDIVVDSAGQAYVTGYTDSSLFPTQNPAQAAIGGETDAFITKINSDGSELLFSSFLGGTYSENYTYDFTIFPCSIISNGYFDLCGGITIDPNGNIYVSGVTESTNFPTLNPLFDTLKGDTDSFVAKFDANGTKLFATYLGGSGKDGGNDLAVDNSGNIYVVGQTASTDFPRKNPIQPNLTGSHDGFVTKLNTSGSEIIYSTYLGQSERIGSTDHDNLFDIAVDDNNNAYVTGYTPPDGLSLNPSLFVAKIGEPEEPSIFPGQDWSVECPFCSVAGTQQYVEGVNPRTGNFTHQESFLNTPVAGGTLSFDFSYIAEATDMYTTTMGYGWAHNNEMSLHFESTALTHTVILQAPGGSRFPFYGNGDGSYERYAGVTSDLVRTDGANPEDTTYEVTTYNQFKARFNDEGKLTEREDPHGNIISFQYADFNGTERLYRAVQGSRYLEYDYYGDGRLHTVKDNNNRTITLTYDANDNLATVTDPTLGTTEYQYEGDHLLNRVIDATDRTVKEVTYDAQGRAYQVRDGEDNLLVDIDFGDGGIATFAMGGGGNFDDLSATSIVTASGVVMAFNYSARGTFTDVLFDCDAGTAGCQNESTVGYNYNFKQDNVEDVNGNPTTMVWNAGGSNLEGVTDALGQQTQMGYDSFNNLTQTIDARGLTTTHRYDNPAFPTFRTSQTNALSQTTIFTPTTVADGVPGMLKAEQNPSGVVTTYKYDSFGQVLETVQAAGTTEAITHTYGYDLAGNLETYSQTSGSDTFITRNFYDASDRLLATIANWDGVLDWANCTFEAGAKDENICTLYRYDSAGRTISNTNALGQTNLSFYDGAGRPFLSVTNYDGTIYNENDPLPALCDFTNPDPELNHCNLTEYDELGRVVTTTDSIGRMNVIEYDSLNRVSRSITNWEDGVFDVNEPDRDIEMHTQYDAVGNALIVMDTVGRMSRTFYDALDRLEGSIDDWTGGITLDDCLTLPVIRDENICTRYEYDEVGNTIIVTDTLGRMSRTFYDELDREQATVENWNPNTLLTAEDCVVEPDNNQSENICTVFGYDDGGNLVTVTNALSQTTLTVYDAANRPFMTVRNWDGTPINSEADCSFPPAQADTNVCSVTYFDILGRQSASKDPMGNIFDITYDSLGRTVTTTQYLDGTPISSHTIYDALGNPLNQIDVYGNSPTNQYDSLNRLQTTTSTEGVARTQQYNAAGWVITTTNNLSHTVVYGYDLLGRRTTVTNAEGDTISYRYDPLGNQVAMIDAEGITTTYEYDDLNRLAAVIENDVPGDNPTNETDVRTTYVHDAFGNRVRVTNARGLTNTFTIYDDLNRPEIVEDALGNRTQTQYNALGMPTVITDANDAATQYFFDGLNRLSSVHYLADGKVFSYAYDAVGNRTVMTDSVGLTQYEYDDLYRVITVTNPFSGQVVYDYNLLGQRTHLTYPDGKVVTYTYDNDYRMKTVLDWDEGITTYHYDDIGRLITTTLPNGVNTINRYDDASHLVELTHVAADDTLVARYEYELDKMGNRRVVTETVLNPEMVASIDAFLEENGMVVAEVESGQLVAGSNHDWISQTVQTGYAGDAYLRALPDVGAVLSGQEAANGPQVNFPVQLDTAGSYAVWVRGMAADAGGDSVHVGLNGQAVATADNITGFTTDEWQWSRLTMDGSDASLDVSSSGVYTVGLLMREDGLRVDKLLLITDTNYIPTGSGPIESLQQTITDTVPAQLIVQTMDYGYDPLYRLTDATYSGAVSATYAYEYDPVGNMEAFTETVGGVTTIINRAFNEANQLIVATDTELGTTSYYYDDNGNLTEIWPPGTNAQNLEGIIRYGFSQGNLLTTQEMYVGGWQLQAKFVYDGNNNRVQQIDHTSSVTTTYHNDNMGLSQVLLADDGTAQTINLFGLDLIAVDDGSETRILLADALGSVRMEMVENEVASSRIYDPYGNVLLQTGSRDTVYGYTGEQEDASTGLVYLRARYYNPSLNQFMSRDSWRGNGMRPITMHGYAYGYNSPPNYNDPTGYDPSWCHVVPSGVPVGDCYPYGLIDFDGADNEQWTIAEKLEVNKAAAQIGKRLAQTYNDYMYGFKISPYLSDNEYYLFNCGENEYPLTAREAFLYFYGGQVLFYKTGTVNPDDATAFGKYGHIDSINRTGISVYTPADITDSNTGYRWATHEMGHYFSGRVNDIRGWNHIQTKLGNYASEDFLNRQGLPLTELIPRRGADNDETSYGFAGTRWGWQQSRETTTGEEFADMFLGWNYNRWEIDDNDELTNLGQARSNFMNRYMASWIALVINREKQNIQ